MLNREVERIRGKQSKRGNLSVVSKKRTRAREGRTMAGMLPGVELARRRRTHHHHNYYHHYERKLRDPSLRDRLDPSISVDETVLKARRRLEEKLGGLSSRWSKQRLKEDRGVNHVPCRVSTVQEKLSNRNSGSEVCAVCLDEFRAQQQIMNLPCSHRYHSECLLPWLTSHSHCPYCRSLVPS